VKKICDNLCNQWQKNHNNPSKSASNIKHKYMKTKQIKQSIILCLLTILSFNVVAQVKIYQGISKNSKDCKYLFQNKTVYKGNIPDSSACILSIDQEINYNGKSTIDSDCGYACKLCKVYKCNNGKKDECLFTVDCNKIYTGNSRYDKNCIFSIKNNEIYDGISPEKSSCIYTFSDNKIYKGASTNNNDCLFTIDGEIKMGALVCILATDKQLYKK